MQNHTPLTLEEVRFIITRLTSIGLMITPVEYHQTRVDSILVQNPINLLVNQAYTESSTIPPSPVISPTPSTTLSFPSKKAHFPATLLPQLHQKLNNTLNHPPHQTYPLFFNRQPVPKKRFFFLFFSSSP